MALSLLVLGLGFQLSPPTQVQGSENAMGKEEYQFNNGALVLIGLLGFVTGYQVGFGPVSWVVVSEVFPLHVRGTALGTAVLINFATNLVMTFSFIPLMDATSP